MFGRVMLWRSEAVRYSSGGPRQGEGIGAKASFRWLETLDKQMTVDCSKTNGEVKSFQTSDIHQ